MHRLCAVLLVTLSVLARPAAALEFKDGLDAYRTIAECALAHLEEGGVVAFEIGFDQREAVTRLMAGHQFRLVEAASDLGGNDRVLVFAAA